MKKILLVTLQGNFNFGNRLQNYALQTVLERMGASVDSLTTSNETWRLTKIRIRNLLNYFQAYFFKHDWSSYSSLRRTIKCIKFSKKYIPGLRYVPINRIQQTDWTIYDCVVAGSDQIWHNWHTRENELSYYYLDFIPNNKKIAYAPSFGFEQFPEKDLQIHQKGLSSFRFLSCRETKGCELIFNLTGKKAEKVLDPTLLLSANDWEKLERRPSRINQDSYIFVYFIGDIIEEYDTEISRIRKNRNLEVININDKSNPSRYGISPQEFIWLIHNADTICTDSFHASVFSILFKKRLRVFYRTDSNGNMFGRLDDLLRPLGLMKNIYGSSTSNDDLETQLSPEAEIILAKAKEKSIKYLTTSVDSICKEISYAKN